MPKRDDVTYFCTHPCHPDIFDFTADEAVQRDFFGGLHAPQNIVCVLIQGPEAHYALREEVAKHIYAPVKTSHRCTLEQVAILESALSESVGATICQAVREAADRAVEMGVPKDAAHDFLLGDMKKETWLDNVFDEAAVKQSVIDICHPDGKP